MNTTQKEKYFDIVNGPNRDAIFDACKYAYDENSYVNVRFEIAMGYTMPKSDPSCGYIPMETDCVKITSVEQEDGSGESFNLKGNCIAKIKRLSGGITVYDSYDFVAYYNTKRRNGTIRFTKR